MNFDFNVDKYHKHIFLDLTHKCFSANAFSLLIA